MIGQHITFTTDSKIYRDTYSSTILDIKDSLMTISIPFHTGVIVLPGVGTKLHVNLGIPGQNLECEILERDIVKKYFILSTPNSICRNSRPRSAAPAKVIAVTSGKGGVGKTSFTINLAIALSQLDRNVLVFDADLGMANLDVLMNIRPKLDIQDVISGEKSIKDIVINAVGSFDFIPGASGFQHLAYLSDSQFNRIISGFNEIEQKYDFMLLDTGAGLSKSVTDFLMASDEIYLVTTTEPHAIMDAYSIVKVMTDIHADKGINLIINKCDSSNEAAAVANKMQSTCKRFINVDISYLGYILEDKNVPKSIKLQIPLLLHSPNSYASKCIKAIAGRCTGCTVHKDNESGITGFLNRLKKRNGALSFAKYPASDRV